MYKCTNSCVINFHEMREISMFLDNNYNLEKLRLAIFIPDLRPAISTFQL